MAGSFEIKKNWLEIADFLLDQGACLEARSGWEDMTPLHFAAYFDCPKVAQLLLCRGADPLVRSAALEGATPLHMAAAQLSLSTARLLAHVPLSVGLPGEPNPDFAPLESPLTCKEALDACLRTPYASMTHVDCLLCVDCLPPAGELPEPLSSMRDRLAELLGPPVDSKTKQQVRSCTLFLHAPALIVAKRRYYVVALLQLVFLGAGCSPSEYRVLPALQHVYVHADHTNPGGGLSPVVGGIRSAATLNASADPTRKMSEGDKRRMPNDISGSLFSGLLAPACSATEVAAPMPAETGVLSPRRPRRTTVASTEPNTPFASPSRSGASVASPPLLHPPPTSTQINHPVPTTSNVSAKVTLQAMGLAIGDRVCVGPGSSASASGGTAPSPKPTTSGRMGRLRYCGPVEFASGIWVGIELDEAFGKNDGSVNGVTYFECTEKHGIFAPIGRVYKVSRSSGQVRPFCVEPNGKRATPTPVQNTPIDVSHVGAKVDTGKISLHKSVALDDIKIGDKVLVAGLRRGIVRFIGETQFAPGVWYGVELSKAVGKNDGSVDGVRYFTCEPKHGVFAPVLRLQKLPSRNRPASNDNLDMSQSVHADFLRDWSSSCAKCPMTPESGHRRSPSAGVATSSMYADTYASLGRMRPAAALSRGAGRTGASDRPAPEDFCLQIGMQVLCTGELGTLRYIGPVDFTDGLWLGVELRGPHGKHDGAVAGRRYFTCPPNHGVLVRPSRVTFRGISAAKLLPPSLAATFERPSKGGEALDTRSVRSHP
ncbi:unnamed protein product [Mesocestoides corti]|uniref:CAP-Gly domain-containing protein n=1 Tax=Mesocestoides corti TaxID=53468 RepID=A0A158QSL4_MESCO|nr:unnamed protein product [Mesocestoides corti]